MRLQSVSVHKKLQAIALACFLAIANVLICFSTAGVVMLELLASGCNKYVALGVAILVAIVCNAYIVFNHKIRDFIRNAGVTDE
jgi:hypothetical protein